MSEMRESRKELELGKIGPVALLLGGIALVICWGLMIFAPEWRRSLMQSYLWAWVFWGGLTMGCFGVTLLHHALKAAWGTAVMRIYEAGGGGRTLIGMAILFIPVLIAMLSGTDILYRWADPSIVAHDGILKWKSSFLEPIRIVIGTLVLFGVWYFFSSYLRRSTLKQDETLNENEAQKRSNLSAPGLVMFVLTCTFAYTAWVMSLDPHWMSQMYPVWMIIGQVLAALGLGTFIVCRNADKLPYSEVVSPKLTRDLGNIMLAFTMFFSYVAFSQYMIIWSGNLPEFTQYYRTRTDGGWSWIAVSMIFLQFFIPFLLLLNPVNKRRPRNLMMIAAWIFLIRIVDSYWIVLPAFDNRVTPMPTVFDLLAFIALGGMWFAMFAGQIRRAPLLPLYDQRLKEALQPHA